MKKFSHPKITAAILIAVAAAAVAAAIIYHRHYGVAILPFSLDPPLILEPGLGGGEFIWRVNRPLNRHTFVEYLIPLDSQGRPRPEASNIIFYAPFKGEPSRIRGIGFQPWLKRLARDSGYTIFSMSIEAGKTDFAPESYYVNPEAGWFELVFRLKKFFERQFDLESRPLLIAGISSGGGMAQRLVELYPERIAAAAWCGGGDYVPPTRKHDVPMLAMSTRDCPGADPSRALAAAAAAVGVTVLHAETPPGWRNTRPPDTHNAGPEALEIISCFFDGIVALRSGNRQIVPPPAQWPLRSGNVPMPSAEFAARWNAIPNPPVEPGKPVFWPRQTATPKKIVLMLAEIDNHPEQILNLLWFVHEHGGIPVALPPDGGLSPETLRNTVEDLLARPEWRELTLHVLGGNGTEAAIAALRKNPPPGDRLRLAGLDLALPPKEPGGLPIRKFRIDEYLYDDELVGIKLPGKPRHIWYEFINAAAFPEESKINAKKTQN